MRHNYWARVPQLLSPHATTTEACAPRARAPQQEKPAHPTKSSPLSPQLEKARAQQRRPNAAKNKMNKINIFKRRVCPEKARETWIKSNVALGSSNYS